MRPWWYVGSLMSIPPWVFVFPSEIGAVIGVLIQAIGLGILIGGIWQTYGGSE